MKNVLIAVVFAFLAGTWMSNLAQAQDAAPPGGGPTSRPEGHRPPPGMMLKGMLDRVGATDEQKAKAQAIMKEARAKAEAAQTPEEKHKIMQEARENVRNNVLTEEQRAKLPKPGEGGPGGPGGERKPGEFLNKMLETVGATAEQKVKAQAIMKEAHEKAQKAESREDKMKIMKEAMENIRNNVLTEEQRAKMPKRGEGGPGGRGGHGGGHGGGPGGAGGPAQ